MKSAALTTNIVWILGKSVANILVGEQLDELEIVDKEKYNENDPSHCFKSGVCCNLRVLLIF